MKNQTPKTLPRKQKTNAAASQMYWLIHQDYHLWKVKISAEAMAAPICVQKICLPAAQLQITLLFMKAPKQIYRYYTY